MKCEGHDLCAQIETGQATVEAPVSSQPLRSFTDHTEAAKWAASIAETNGWPVADRTSQDSD